MPPLGNSAIDSRLCHVALSLQDGQTNDERLVVWSGSGLFQSLTLTRYLNRDLDLKYLHTFLWE